MADKNQRRAQKKREKQRKKRAEAQRSRGSREQTTPSAIRDRGLKGAERWPVGDCYLSESWHEQGAHIHAGFVRENSDGRQAAAFFEIDLAERGIVEVLARGNVSYEAVQGEMVRRSEQTGHSMLVVDADLVAKVVHTGLALGRSAGTPDPSGLDEALRLFGDVDGSATDAAILTGRPPPPPPKKKSLFTLLFGD